jgi:hypothetical protein
MKKWVIWTIRATEDEQEHAAQPDGAFRINLTLFK